MGKKNNFNITLAGKSYTLCGEESSEYLKRIGTYLEQKYNGYYGNLSFRSQPIDMQHVLMQLNIADDYFKCKEQLELQLKKNEEQLAEMESLQKSLVSMQVRYENLESGMKMIEKKYQEAKKMISKLED